MTRKIYSLFAGLLLVLFVCLAFFQLDVRPLHNDEGVNASFLFKLINSFASYQYDPNNYHGPSLYYIQWIPSLMYGITPAIIRSSVVVAALFLLIGIVYSHKYWGFWGSLCSLVLLVSSCDFIYFSRYFIHELFLVLFTFGIYWGIVFYSDTKKTGFLYLATLSTALVYCTKETSIITFVVLLFAYFLSHFFSLRMPNTRVQKGQVLKEATEMIKAIFLEHPLSWNLALWVVILLYTSFFTNWSGILDSFLTYLKWVKEGVESGHNKPFFYYLHDILLRYEIPLCIAASIGFSISLITKEKRGLFCSFWALGMFVAYSSIPYKTPWLILNFILPMALSGGYGFQKISDWITQKRKNAYKNIANGSLLCILAMVLCLQWPKIWRVVYVEYDSERHPQAYVHTSRDIFKLVSKISNIADKSGLGRSMDIHIIGKNCWPLPIYLKNYTRTAFISQAKELSCLDAPVVIVDAFQRMELFSLLKNSYSVQEYSLHPYCTLLLYTDRRYEPQSSSDGEKKTPSVLLPCQINPTLLKPFLYAQIKEGPRFDGPILATNPSIQNLNLCWDKEADKPFISPFFIRYWGYIRIQIAGEYTFCLESDDGSWLYINGYPVLDNRGYHRREKRSSVVSLEAGYHQIEIQYFDLGGSAFLRTTWIPPARSEEKLPNDILFHAE